MDFFFNKNKVKYIRLYAVNEIGKPGIGQVGSPYLKTSIFCFVIVLPDNGHYPDFGRNTNHLLQLYNKV